MVTDIKVHKQLSDATTHCTTKNQQSNKQTEGTDTGCALFGVCGVERVGVRLLVSPRRLIVSFVSLVVVASYLVPPVHQSAVVATKCAH